MLGTAKNISFSPCPPMQMQLATKSKGQRDDITVIVIDALPAEDMRLPPALQAKKSGSTMIARYVTLTVF